jgi:hypothetical protein
MRKKGIDIEERISKYKNRMELVRTVIGIVVLGIQIIILTHLLSK